MRLSARAIINYANINSFSYANQWIVNAGDPLTLYFQIVDLDQGPYAVIGTPYNVLGVNSQLSGNVGLRYIPGATCGACNAAPQPVAVSVTFPSLDSTNVITANASLANPADGSIWKISLASSQQPAGGNVLFSVMECNGTKTFQVLNLLNVVFPSNNGCC